MSLLLNRHVVFRLSQYAFATTAYSDRSHSSVLTNFNGNPNRFKYQPVLMKPAARNISFDSIVAWQQGVYTSISHSSTVGVFQDAILNIHTTTGLPWWATIVLTTVIIRTSVTVPLAIYQNYILAKVENLVDEFKGIIEELKMETAMAKKQYNISDKKLRVLFAISMKKQWKKLLIRDNCHPFKSTILVFFQMPMWICTSFALRNLVSMEPVPDALALITYTELSVEGFGWIPNLIDVDHSLILPVFLALLNLTIVELQVMTKMTKQTSRLRKNLTHVFRAVAVIVGGISACVPSALCLYWTVSSAYGLCQNLILLSPKVKRKCGIPVSPSEIEYPYTHLKLTLGDRFKNIGDLLRKTPKP